MAATPASSRSTWRRSSWPATASASCSFEPVGVAQGWSPVSYADVGRESLQDLGYERIAIGGLVAQKTHEILAVLEAIDEIREPETRLHLLGVTRTERVAVVPALRRDELRQHLAVPPGVQGRSRQLPRRSTRTWIALRIPQVDGNAKLQRRIRAGEVDGRAGPASRAAGPRHRACLRSRRG